MTVVAQVLGSDPPPSLLGEGWTMPHDVVCQTASYRLHLYLAILWPGPATAGERFSDGGRSGGLAPKLETLILQQIHSVASSARD